MDAGPSFQSIEPIAPCVELRVGILRLTFDEEVAEIVDVDVSVLRESIEGFAIIHDRMGKCVQVMAVGAGEFGFGECSGLQIHHCGHEEVETNRPQDERI